MARERTGAGASVLTDLAPDKVQERGRAMTNDNGANT
jgi:hypothetical protein